MKNGSVEVKLADGSQFSERGTIELLNNEANARTDTIQIYASFPNEERKLVMGNTLTVTLFRANGKMLPAVTPSALMHDSNGSYVYVLDSANKVEKRYVTPRQRHRRTTDDPLRPEKRRDRHHQRHPQSSAGNDRGAGIRQGEISSCFRQSSLNAPGWRSSSVWSWC
ncbi:MAG: efflux RND transporter periplasmic adaptor subunit [Lentisphaeria bacterium]|nr:MAG: efflux RND transporter periplasmic adaptor subunit [Lentisphaeria bacterium]